MSSLLARCAVVVLVLLASVGVRAQSVTVYSYCSPGGVSQPDPDSSAVCPYWDEYPRPFASLVYCLTQGDIPYSGDAAASAFAGCQSVPMVTFRIGVGQSWETDGFWCPFDPDPAHPNASCWLVTRGFTPPAAASGGASGPAYDPVWQSRMLRGVVFIAAGCILAAGFMGFYHGRRTA